MASARIGFSDYGYWNDVPLTWLLVWLTKKFVVGMWLSQQHKYQADATGAVISKAAGCSSDSTLTAMHRHYAASVDLQYLDHKDFADDVQLQMQKTLAALQQLVPTRQLPLQVLHSKQFAGVAQLVEFAIKDAPADVQEQATALMAQMEHCLGKYLSVFKDLWDIRFSSHPYWLDRVKRVEEVLASLPSVSRAEQDTGCEGKRAVPSSVRLSQ